MHGNIYDSAGDFCAAKGRDELGEALGDDDAATGDADDGEPPEVAVAFDDFVGDAVQRALNGGCVEEEACGW